MVQGDLWGPGQCGIDLALILCRVEQGLLCLFLCQSCTSAGALRGSASWLSSAGSLGAHYTSGARGTRRENCLFRAEWSPEVPVCHRHLL